MFIAFLRSSHIAQGQNTDGAGHNHSNNRMHCGMWIYNLVVGRMSRTTSAVVGSFVSDESEVSEVSKKKYDRNSISCLTGGGKLQMTNPTTPDLTPFQSSVQGNR